jgi:hypothetical protein
MDGCFVTEQPLVEESGEIAGLAYKPVIEEFEISSIFSSTLEFAGT